MADYQALLIAYNSSGDQQGLRFVFDICKPDRVSKGNHYLVPRATARSQPAEVIALLCKQGAFSLPPETACRDLLRCYFHYVHPFLPIVNASDFLTQYLRGDQQKVNLLLLWSMFFAAASVSQTPKATVDVLISVSLSTVTHIQLLAMRREKK